MWKENGEEYVLEFFSMEIGQCFNFQSVNYPTHYIHNSDGKILIEETNFTATGQVFRKDFTWKLKPGNSAKIAEAISLESMTDEGKDNLELCSSEGQ